VVGSSVPVVPSAGTPRVLPRLAAGLGLWTKHRVAPLSLIAFMLGVWSLERVLIGHVHGGRPIGYLAFGALPNATVVGRGSPDQWWRYVTNALVHDKATLLPLGINAVGLLVVGRWVEQLYGRLVFLATLPAATVAGGIAWMAWSALGLAAMPGYTQGASAGVCGLIGLLFMYGRADGTSATRESRRQVSVRAVGALLLFGLAGLLVPNVNTVAHASALVCGLLLGRIIPAMASAGGRAQRQLERAALWSVLAVSAVAVVMAGQNLVQRLLQA
jgi:membrane associated rhomboid family serine protease